VNGPSALAGERFFEKCELEFTHHLIDDFRDPAYFTWRQTTQFKF
jgi:sulfite reductase beta subunit